MEKKENNRETWIKFCKLCFVSIFSSAPKIKNVRSWFSSGIPLLTPGFLNGLDLFLDFYGFLFEQMCAIRKQWKTVWAVVKLRFRGLLVMISNDIWWRIGLSRHAAGSRHSSQISNIFNTNLSLWSIVAIIFLKLMIHMLLDSGF